MVILFHYIAFVAIFPMVVLSDCVGNSEAQQCDESLISGFNIIFGFILFRFKFILFSYYFLLDLFYFNCILLYFRNEYLIDLVLEQKKED